MCLPNVSSLRVSWDGSFTDCVRLHHVDVDELVVCVEEQRVHHLFTKTTIDSSDTRYARVFRCYRSSFTRHSITRESHNFLRYTKHVDIHGPNIHMRLTW